MSKRLEVGDMVVYVEGSRYDEFCNYYFKTVESVTNTRAKISGGVTLLREPNKRNKYDVYGKMSIYGEWELLTEEIKNKSSEARKVREHRRKINDWFKNFSPDFATKEVLYKQFNQES